MKNPFTMPPPPRHRTLYLTYARVNADDVFVVHGVVNSIEFLPGEVLRPDLVAGICDNRNWTVIIRRVTDAAPSPAHFP